MEYEDIVASNPTTVKERIDDALQNLANLSKSQRSRAEILADLAKYAQCENTHILPIEVDLIIFYFLI